MTSKKVFYGLLSLLCLSIIASLLATYYGAQQLQKTGDTLYERKLEQAALQKDEQTLSQAKHEVEKYNELLQIAKSIVPQEKDQARTVREIVAIAAKSNIKIESISFPASNLGEKPKSNKKNTKAAPTGTTQLMPVEGLNGVYAMPITVSVNRDNPVSYNQLLNFLGDLEKNRRTSHVINLSIQPQEDDRNLVTFSFQLNAYIKP